MKKSGLPVKVGDRVLYNFSGRTVTGYCKSISCIGPGFRDIAIFNINPDNTNFLYRIYYNPYLKRWKLDGTIMHPDLIYVNTTKIELELSLGMCDWKYLLGNEKGLQNL